jgi:hypothetical protein
MYSIYFKASPDIPFAVHIGVNDLLEAQHYWDKLSKSNFYMVSTRP